MKAVGILLIILFSGLGVFAARWLYFSLSRKKLNDLREQHLKRFILEDPRMRNLYLETRKQNPKESEK